MTKSEYTVLSNQPIAPGVFRLSLSPGEAPEAVTPGQFINIRLDGFYLRRPISVYDFEDGVISVIYKVVGRGTEYMTALMPGAKLDCLVGLGNGYDTSLSGDAPVLIGGGAGIPPLYFLAKKLISEGKDVTAVLGFNTADEVFCERDFRALGADTVVTTVDGSYGRSGYAPRAADPGRHTYVYTCGPLPMLKAVYNGIPLDGQFSLEERMGCGFGACMGCSVRTRTGYKRVCKDGPVFFKDELCEADWSGK